MTMDVVCLGILVADIFASPIDSLPAAGELRLVDRYQLSAGGCAANTAACLRRLGRKVRVVSKVGENLFGDFVKEDLERLGVDTFAVRRSSTHPTSNLISSTFGARTADFSIASVLTRTFASRILTSPRWMAPASSTSAATWLCRTSALSTLPSCFVKPRVIK